MSINQEEDQKWESSVSSPTVIQESFQQIQNINTQRKRPKGRNWKTARFIVIQVTLNFILSAIIIWQVRYFLSLPPSNQVLYDCKVNQPTNQVRPYDDYIYVLWPDESELTGNRLKNIDTIVNSELQVIFISLKTLDRIFLKDQPVHPAFQYLSSVHKSDYLRQYIMHYYGGSYTDLKTIKQSYVEARDKLREQTQYFGAGYYEKRARDVPVYRQDRDIQIFVNKNYNKIIGNAAYMFRPSTEFTLRWHYLHDEKLQSLKEKFEATPAHHSRDRWNEKCGYPLRWAQLGAILVKVQKQFFGRLTGGVPYVIMKDHL